MATEEDLFLRSDVDKGETSPDTDLRLRSAADKEGVGSVTVTPPTLALILSLFAPTILTPVLITPTTLGLSTSLFAPSIAVDFLVTPPTLSLSSTLFAPTVSTPRLVTPATLVLSLTPFVPVVTATGNVLVTPATRALSLTLFVPVVSISGGITVTPPTQALALSLFVPTVSIDLRVTPATLALALSTLVPTVTPTTYTSYGVPFLFTEANWGAGIAYYLEIYFKAVAGTVYARLLNVTDDTVVTDSGLSTVETSYTRLRSSALTLTDGKAYVAQFGTEGVASGHFEGAKIVAV